jgi:hypothetical protein
VTSRSPLGSDKVKQSEDRRQRQHYVVLLGVVVLSGPKLVTVSGTLRGTHPRGGKPRSSQRSRVADVGLMRALPAPSPVWSKSLRGANAAFDNFRCESTRNLDAYQQA